jgi:EAL domain-containing protein (putative c-di-GMP-specific phosphodiesterase class I)
MVNTDNFTLEELKEIKIKLEIDDLDLSLQERTNNITKIELEILKLQRELTR